MIERPPSIARITGSTASGLTPEQRYRIVHAVASAATDAADCVLLLDALGLHPTDGLRRPDDAEAGTVPGPRRGTVPH